MNRIRHTAHPERCVTVPAAEIIEEPLNRYAISPNQPACCCTAPAVVRIVVAYSVPRTRSVDLLLCGHHYRTSRAELTRRGAMVFDQDGSLLGTEVESVDWGSEPCTVSSPATSR